MSLSAKGKAEQAERNGRILRLHGDGLFAKGKPGEFRLTAKGKGAGRPGDRVTAGQPFPEEMIEALAFWTHDALFSLGGSDHTLTGVRLKEMADGSGNWAVFADTYDSDGAEHAYRTIVNRAGETVSIGEVSRH